MSTSETATFDANVCPCGQGKVVKHVTTQDNPWSSADIAYALECERCHRQGWMLERGGGALVLRSSEAPSSAAYDVWMRSSKQLHELVGKLVDDYFSRFAAKSKKAECGELHRLGIYAGNYRGYLKSRSGGETIGQISYGLRNQAWLASLAEIHNCKEQLDALIHMCESKRNEWEDAAKKIVRWPINATN